jgi:hypothetical protein
MIGELRQPFDIIEEFDPGRIRILKKAAEIYENGSSAREVSHKLRLAKSTVIDGLKRLGVQRQQHVPRAPYGYVCVEGKLVEHPLEKARIQIMLDFAHKGLKAWRIAEELRRLKIPSRKGGRWCHKTIQRIMRAKSPSTDSIPF